jgi:hypothetical protein
LAEGEVSAHGACEEVFEGAVGPLDCFTIFWANETDPANKRQFPTLIFESVRLDQDRVVAVQPTWPFFPFFQNEHRRSQIGKTAGVKYGSDGGQNLDCCLAD